MRVEFDITKSPVDLVRENFRATRGTPSLYLGTLLLMLIVSYSGGFNTDKMGPFMNRFSFFLLLGIILFLTFHIVSAVVTIFARKVVFGNLKLELLTSIPVAAVGVLVNDPLVISLSELGRVTLSKTNIFANYFIFIPIFIVSFSYHTRSVSSLYSIRKLHSSLRQKDALAIATGEPAASAAFDKSNIAHAPLFVESEDHSIKVVYEHRVVIKRKSLSDEIRNWQTCGFRVHKSFWVNSQQMERRERIGRRMYLVLKSGQRIPVGRSFEKNVIRAMDIRETEFT